MSEFSQSGKAAQMLEKREAEKKESMSTVILDGSNRARMEGLPFELEARNDSIIVNVDVYRSGYECSLCNGSGVVYQPIDDIALGEIGRSVTCPECKGKKAILFTPDESQSLPTTGVIVSVGAMAKAARPDLEEGKRVLFGPHSGQFIPLKQYGVLFKVMHEREATCFVYGGDDLASAMFVMQDTRLS